MRILAVMGSYRKGKCVDTLMDKAIEGALSRDGVTVDKLVLLDKNIKYCTNCLSCRDSKVEGDYVPCIISDDMDEIAPMIARADAFIFGTSIIVGNVTAVMKTFLDRVCWTFARPGCFPLRGCPTPRTKRERRNAVMIMAAGVVPPILRRFCDDATGLVSSVCKDILNAKLIGSLYAGAVERRGLDGYLPKAFELGRKLAT